MSDLSENSSEPIVFQRSRLGRVSLFVKAALGCLLLQAVAAAIVWWAVGFGLHGGSPPVWLHVVGAAVIVALVPVTWLLCNASEPTMLALHDEDLRIGGTLIRRRVRYDDVRLLRLEDIDDHFTRSVRLVIQRRRGTARKIVLPKQDAIECFHALRQMSPQAAAMEFDDDLYAPVDLEHEQEGRMTLARTLLRKSMASFTVSIGLGLVTLLLCYGLILSGTVTQHPLRAVYSIGLPLLGALFTGVQAVHYWRRRALVLNAEFIIGPDQDDDDDAHEGTSIDEEEQSLAAVKHLGHTEAGTR